MEKQEYIVKDLADLVPYARNARTHSPEQVEQIAASIKEFGFINPVIIGADNGVIAGHGRIMAAQKLGISKVPCIVASHLTDEQRRAYILADNKLAENAGWDNDLLRIELTDLQAEGFDLTLTGFDLNELNGMLQSMVQEAEEKGEPKEEEVPDVEEVETRCNKGNIWQLGAHRLMCGDSTDALAVTKLMDGQRADICFTSPPYNAMNGFRTSDGLNDAYMKKGGVYKEYHDDLTDEGYCQFLTQALDCALAFCDDVLFNIGYTKGALKGTALFLGANANRFGGALSWIKSNAFVPQFPVQHGIMTNVAEPIYLFNQCGKRKLSHPQWDRTKACNNVIETENASGNEYAQEHGATFPVALAYEAISRFTEKSVLDLFGGTGTTMIAAEQLGRACFMMELDPTYCDIIIRRWEKHTGKTAQLLQD